MKANNKSRSFHFFWERKREKIKLGITGSHLETQTPKCHLGASSKQYFQPWGPNPTNMWAAPCRSMWNPCEVDEGAADASIHLSYLENQGHRVRSLTGRQRWGRWHLTSKESQAEVDWPWSNLARNKFKNTTSSAFAWYKIFQDCNPDQTHLPLQQGYCTFIPYCNC